MATARRLMRLMTTAATLQHHGSYAQTGMRIVLWQAWRTGHREANLGLTRFRIGGNANPSSMDPSVARCIATKSGFGQSRPRAMIVRLRVILWIFVITAVVVLGCTFVTYQFGNQVLRAHQREQIRRQVITDLDEITSTVKDAETGQRGFIITGDERTLFLSTTH